MVCLTHKIPDRLEQIELAAAKLPPHFHIAQMRSQPPPMQALGFPKPTDVAGLKSIAHLFGTTKPRCGIYILDLPHGRHYIGQAVDVVRRFAQHAKTHAQIEAFAFLSTPRSKLNQCEKELIFEAERASLTLVNVVHVSDVEGETDLDALLSPQVVNAWLENPYLQNENDFNTNPVALSSGHTARFEPNFAKFKEHPLFWSALIQLFSYLESAVPYPRTTEYSFWAVSCMPSTNKKSWPRLLCVNASVMEVFVLGYYKDPRLAGCGWGFMNVASDVLFDTYGGEAAFQTAHPNVEVLRRPYRDAGQHQVSLHTQDQADMLALLDDTAVTQAAAALCLRLMRKRATIYSRYHCPQVVNEALALRSMEETELNNLIDAVFTIEHEDDSAPPAESAAVSRPPGVPPRGE